MREFIEAQTEAAGEDRVAANGRIAVQADPASQGQACRCHRTSGSWNRFCRRRCRCAGECVCSSKRIRPLPLNSNVCRRLWLRQNSFEGLALAILGKPNVGKSSLFNRLVSCRSRDCDRNPGTTRDVLTETISLDGVPLRFADTAGVRDTADQVESIGVTRTFETLAEADLALVVLDGSTALDDDDRRDSGESCGRSATLIVINKIGSPAERLTRLVLNGARRVRVERENR